MDLDELNGLDKPQYGELNEDDNCPNCDGKLVKRYARNFEGKEFLGCSNYPRCKFTQNI